MVWFCHDIVYGKTKHVNELGPQWIRFSWVVLVIWLSYMITEVRASLDFLASRKSAAASDLFALAASIFQR